MNKIVVACFASLLSVAAFGARAISAFSVETVENGNTVFNLAFDAGNAGDSHALYYAWSNDGKDYGEDPAGWPNVLRVGRVADDATEFSFEMPEGKATITPLYAARAFLAKSEVAYDYLIESLYVSKTQKCYLDTGFKPQGGKTAVTMDLKLYYSGLDANQTYVFGSNAGLSLCAYINGNGCWAFSCDDGSGSWTNPTTLEAKKERVRVTVDSKIPEAVFTVEGETGSASDTTKETHDNTATVNLYLFGRSGTSGNDKDCALTFYSCSITNDGVCVRDYRPCVKDGVVGIYDSANNTFSTSSGTTAFSSPGANATYFVNSGDETVGSAIWKFASSDLSINEPYVENNNLSFEGGAMKSGPAPLTLVGLNDFGGLFTVADGTLVADFGRGLAETDRLVLDGGTYCPLSSETLNVSFDAENPKIFIPSSASGGFSAYGHPLSVTIGDDASVPLVFGTETFSPGRFILNDDYADSVLTFENGMSSASSMAIETASNVAVVKGDIDNAENFSRYGNGTLVLEGSNTLASLFMHDAGTTVLASSSRETPGWAQVDRVSAVEGADLIVSNAYLKHTGKTGSITVNCGSTLEFVDSTVSAKSIYPANRPIKGSKTGMLLIDGTVFSADEIQAGYYHSANSNATSQIVITNGSTVTVGEFYGRHGSAVQYSGYLKVTDKASGSFRLSTSGASTFTYTLYGGTIERTHSGDSGWHVGMNQQKGNSKGHFYVYGGEVIMRCKNGYIGRYGNEKKDSGRDSGSVYVRGGSLTMPYSGCALYVGHGGNGFLESSGGVIDINGSVVAVLKNSATGRRGEVQLLSGGKLIAKSLYSTCTNDVAVLVFDGGNFVAKTGSAANFIYGFTEAYIGASGGTIDTAGQDLSVVQSFAAREGQTWDVPETGDALAAAPAFTKDGEGTLVFAGTNTYLCATAVSNGTLVATCDESLPSTTTVRLGENGVLDLSGQENTVANLIGAGKVENGTINVTGTVYPGWGDAKTLTVSSLKAGRIEYAVSGDGTTGKLKVEGPLDLSGVEIVVENADNAESGLEIIEAESITGVPTSVLSGSYAITVYGNGVRVGLAPTIILVK